jgi:hypothetical protein
MARAPDGATWLSDRACQGLLRLAASRASPCARTRCRRTSPPARRGGAWFTQDVQPVVGHADAGGAITRAPYDLRRGTPPEVPEAARISLPAGYGTRTPRRLERTFDRRGRYTYRMPKLWVSRIAGLAGSGRRDGGGEVHARR